MFYSFDGIDGGGKSTQLKLFCDWLAERGEQVVICRDPGSTPLGEAVRELLLNRHDLEIHRRSEMLLYMAAQAQLVEEVIRPGIGRRERRSSPTVFCWRMWSTKDMPAVWTSTNCGGSAESQPRASSRI